MKVKRIIAMFLAVLVIVTCMSGCGSKTVEQEETINKETSSSETTETSKEGGDREKLYFWFWGAATNYQEHMKSVLCDWFYNAQDKYELVLEFRSTVDADIPVALAAGEGPDIVYTAGPSYSATYAQENLILDLSKYAEQYGWEDRLLSSVYDACTMDGKLYSLPGGLEVGGLFYNKEVFENEGWTVPTTVDELVSTMEAAKVGGYYPLGAGNKGWKPCNDHFASMIMSAYLPPSKIHDALTGRISFTDSDIVNAVEESAEWYRAGYVAGEDYVNLDSSEVMQTLMNKKSAMVAAPSLYFQWLEPGYEDVIGFVPMPNNYTDHDVYNVYVTSCFAINANTPAADECAMILDYMMSTEFTMAMNAEWPAYWNMPIKDLADADGSGLTGISKMCFDAVQDAIKEIDSGYFWYHPSTFFPAATVTAFEDIDTVWQGVMDAESFCEAVNVELTNDIANKLVPPLAEPAV